MPERDPGNESQQPTGKTKMHHSLLCSFLKIYPPKNLIKYSTNFVFSDDKTCVFQKFYILSERLFIPAVCVQHTDLPWPLQWPEQAQAVGSNIP